MAQTNTESFQSLIEQYLVDEYLKPGAFLLAHVTKVEGDGVTVNANLKSDAFIPLTEFGKQIPAVGDEIEVVVDHVDNSFGETRLSHEKAKRAKVWKELGSAQENNEVVVGTIIERVKGGFTVDLNGVRAFLPGSLIDVKPVRDPGYLESQELEFKIIKMDQQRNNVVVSRRAVMENENSADREKRLSELQEGQEVVGIIKNITDYGAFVDLGGVDGLLHITDMSWKRVKHPSEILNVGDEKRVKILKFDREKNRVSLGIKQLGDDPWENIARRYPQNTRLYGKVTNITDYGCFVELEDGVEGLVHMSEMDWTNKNVHPSKIVKPGDEVEVMVLDIDEDRRRISLGVKQCKMNPWQEFAQTHQKGETITGNVRSITDFGLFIGLDGEIDGLVHLTDISWTQSGEDAVRDYKKGDEVTSIILGVDPERERISLGIKQLDTDPHGQYLNEHEGSIVKAKVLEVDPKFATVELAEGIKGILKAGELKADKVEDLSTEVNVADELEVKVLGMDRKTQQINVSVKAVEMGESKPQAAPPKRKPAKKPEVAKTTLGDLLKEQMKGSDED